MVQHGGERDDGGRRDFTLPQVQLLDLLLLGVLQGLNLHQVSVDTNGGSEGNVFTKGAVRLFKLLLRRSDSGEPDELPHR